MITIENIGCPNAPEPPVCGVCDNCREDIHAGDEYWESDGRYVCEYCAADMTSYDVLRMDGWENRTAS